jgi:nucleoside-diphosphate-sugar epimerase
MFLVTGGSGFIGSQVVRALLAKGGRVLVYDRETPKSTPWKSMAGKIEHVKGDLMDWERLLETIRNHKIEAIVHLAYYRDIVEQENRPLKATQVNCLGFNQVLEVARLSGVKRVVWSSSTAVYGLPSLYTEPVNEDAPTQPATLYGACKVYDEYLARHYTRQFGLETIGLRPAIVYGEGRWYSGHSSFARDLFVHAVTGQPMVIQEADRRINWIHVKDVAQAFIKACYVERVEHHIFNLVAEMASIRQVAEIVRERVPAAKIEIKGGGEGIRPVQLDGSRAREELDFEPTLGLRKGIAEYLEILQRELNT